MNQLYAFPLAFCAIIVPIFALPSGCTSPTSCEGAACKSDEPWNRRNDPARFREDLNYYFDELPESGSVSREPWPSTYWPGYRDGINQRWNGNDFSPAEKYDLAFNGWEPPAGFEDLTPFSRENADSWDEAYYSSLGPLAKETAFRQNSTYSDRIASKNAPGGVPEKWPVPTWWGLCHSWVKASILEDRPLHPVTENGVTFEVADLEALLIAAYDRGPGIIVGDRCNDSEMLERDEYGRARDVQCRDSNAGSFHVIVTNFVGLFQQSFAEDRTASAEVWNQPIVSFEVLESMSLSEKLAAQRVGLSGDEYTFNPDADAFQYISMRLDYLAESDASTKPASTSAHTRSDSYEYILELDADRKIVGGEWLNDSKERAPDFLWLPSRIDDSTYPHLNIERVRRLIRLSRRTPEFETKEYLENLSEPLAIPDDGQTSVSHSLIADTHTGTFTSLRVALLIDHEFMGDLQVTLHHEGVSAPVLLNELGSEGSVNNVFTLDDFSGTDPAGEWRLEVLDTRPGKTGSLHAWGIELSYEN